MTEKNQEGPPSSGPITKQRAFRISLAITIAVTILIGIYLLPEETKQETTSLASVETTPVPENIEAIYQERYKAVVDSLNEFETRTSLETLKSIKAPPKSIHDLFFQGILFAWLGQDQPAAQRLTAAALSDPRPLSSIMLVRNAKKWRLNPAGISVRQFSPSDCPYMRRCYFLQRIANRIIAGSQNDMEKAERLVEWVFRHVAFFEPDVTYASPMDILLRGYGLCDRSAWILALLCQRAGLPASIALLQKPTETISNHTLCQILVSRRWLLCDTTQGTFVRLGPDGALATFENIIPRLEKERDNASFQEEFGVFREAGIAVVYEAEGAFPRFSLLEPYLRVIQPYIPLFVDLQAQLDRARTALSNVGGDRRSQVGVWGYPFFVVGAYRNPSFSSVRQKYLSRMLAYRDGRFLQLLGFPREAIQAYAKSGENCAAEAREDILYFIAQCFREAGNLDDAEANFSLYLSRHPDGRWKKMATYHLARIKEETGDLSAAVKLYRTIHEIGAARQRASVLETQMVTEGLPEAAKAEASTKFGLPDSASDGQ